MCITTGVLRAKSETQWKEKVYNIWAPINYIIAGIYSLTKKFAVTVLIRQVYFQFKGTLLKAYLSAWIRIIQAPMRACQIARANFKESTW